MAGTSDKMLEYLLETRMDCEKDEADMFVDDFLLTYLAFGLSNSVLCNMLSVFLHQKLDSVEAVYSSILSISLKTSGVKQCIAGRNRTTVTCE